MPGFILDGRGNCHDLQVKSIAPHVHDQLSACLGRKVLTNDEIYLRVVGARTRQLHCLLDGGRDEIRALRQWDRRGERGRPASDPILVLTTT